jgi:hypothetical protein
MAATSNILRFRQKQRPSVQVVTTLYELVEAVSEEVRPDEQQLITPVVQELLRDCSTRCLCNQYG